MSSMSLASSHLISLICWSYLPSLVSGWLQAIYYAVAIRARDPKPLQSSPRYIEHRRRIQILVVSLYLVYTLIEADYDLVRLGSFYTDLSLSSSASTREIKQRFRRLAAVHHPDKQAPGTSIDEANAYFVRLKTASETLLNPIQRFAYDRFGPVVAQWQHCTTVRDYVARGAQVIMFPWYAAALMGLASLDLFGLLSRARYERWLVFAVLFVFDFYTVTRPQHSFLLARVLNPALDWMGRIFHISHPPYLPFQVVQLARRLSVTLYVGFSQLGPLLRSDTSVHLGGQSTSGDGASLRAALDTLAKTATELDLHSSRLMELETAPFIRDPQVVACLRDNVQEWLVENTVRSHPTLKNALRKALRKLEASPAPAPPNTGQESRGGA